MNMHFHLLPRPRLFISLALMLNSLAALCQSEKPIPTDTSYNPQHAWSNIVKRYPDSKLVPSKLPAGVKAEYNVVYATLEKTPYGRRDLRLDVFQPAKKGRYPALL